MNVVGEDLEAQGYEFLAVNSTLKKDPQFVCLKNKKLHFVVVKAVTYPKNPASVDFVYMETIKEHALKFKARTYFAGVGIANASDYEKPVIKNQEYVVNYQGLVEI